MAGKYTGFDQLGGVAKNAVVSSAGTVTAAIGRQKAQRGFGPTMSGPIRQTILNQDPNNPRYGQRYREIQKVVNGVVHLVHDYAGHHVDMGPLKGRTRPVRAEAPPATPTTMKSGY